MQRREGGGERHQSLPEYPPVEGEAVLSVEHRSRCLRGRLAIASSFLVACNGTAE